MSKPRIAIIAAMARNRVIGIDNKLPWHLPADLQHFKQLTMGLPMVMGRKTWESLPGRLPGRPHIVVTRDEAYQAEGAQVVHSLPAAIEQAQALGKPVMIIGGANLYAQALELADTLYLTEVDTEVDGDAWFPDFAPAAWQLVAREDHPVDDRNRHAHSFLTYRRV